MAPPATYLAPTDPLKPQGAVGFPAPSGAPLPATIPFSNDLSLEIPLPSTERRVSPAGWSSRRLSLSLYIPDSGAQSVVGRLKGEAAGGS